MDADRAIGILERQRAVITDLQHEQSQSAEFAKWRRDTEIAIERIFSPGSRSIDDFKSIQYSLTFFTSGTPDARFHEAYVAGLRKADAILASMVDEVREYEADAADASGAPDNLNLIERICNRFHAVARQLRSRRSERTTLTIEDEYDVQDLLHALLKLHFEDIRAEEWTPSYAGRSSRVDFLLKDEGIVVEVKKTRPSLKDGELGEQLIIDRARYEAHPDCKTLVCFIYDPEGRIGNPTGLARDLENQGGTLQVRVIVAPSA